mmetsp:Transcript_33064/g.36867  ORF Transcript_33064/g.36867 Transcript_33064/m.36867 type:complete len:106 (+) Transcript_33064:300-617(+)
MTEIRFIHTKEEYDADNGIETEERPVTIFVSSSTSSTPSGTVGRKCEYSLRIISCALNIMLNDIEDDIEDDEGIVAKMVSSSAISTTVGHGNVLERRQSRQVFFP